jgi:MFS family permease
MEKSKLHIGSRNLRVLYGYMGSSQLWFDAGLWVIYLQHMGISLVVIGLLEAWLHVVNLLVDIPAGIFADRFGWKKSILISKVAGIAYGVFMLWGGSPWLFFLAFGARGLQSTFESGATASMTYESAKWAGFQSQYKKISGRMYAITLVSLGVAELAGGRLATVSWHLLYAAVIGANALSAIQALRLTEPRSNLLTVESVEETPVNAWQIARASVQFARKNRKFARWLWFSAVFSGFVSVFGFYGQVLFIQSGWSLIGIGLLFGVENGVSAIASLLADSMTRKIGERKTLLMTGGLGSLGLIGFAWVPGIGKGFAYLIQRMALSLVDPIIDHRLNELIPSAQRATLLSANSTAFSVFMMIGFPLFGWVAQRTNLQVATVYSCIVAAIAILTVTLVLVKEDREGGMEINASS